jgi:uncharacterized repeat protein (TIGR03843 family)
MSSGTGAERAHAPMDEAAVLARGEVSVRGRIRPASNLTFLGEVTLDGHTAGCVYKPVSGERPLWDFPDGTLARREVAAYLVSEALGWRVVPPTVLREGPLGPGMVQLWCEPDPAQEPVDLVPEGSEPAGYRHVLDALDAADRPVSLVHEDSVPLRRMAVFDALVNNADRKGGHVLAMADGHRYGVDHGVTFHVEPKLRTVLWGWADEPLHSEEVEAVAVLAADLSDPAGPLPASLHGLLHPSETGALRDRCERLLSSGRMPLPSQEWPAIPWPAF